MEENLRVIEDRAAQLVDDHTELLRALAGLRHERGLSQATVAERMGVSQPAVAAFERYDANPTLASVRRYALAVGARIESIVTEAEG